jgi:hypothetical protein
MGVTVSTTENAVTVVPAVNTVTVASVGVQGIPGPTGADGVHVDAVAFVANDMVFTLSDASTVTMVGAKTDLKGDTGAAGADGADGAAGADGADGADGKTVLNGAIDPTTEGVDGDFYLNTATHTIFGPKSGTWPAGVSLVGPAGVDGVDGADGAATFLELTDTPSTFTAGKWLKVNTGGTALEWVDEPAGSYTLPTASDSVLGGVKVGSGLSITDGVLAATGGSGTDAATVNSLVFAQTY